MTTVGPYVGALLRTLQDHVSKLILAIALSTLGYAPGALADTTWSPMHLRLILVSHERQMPVMTPRYTATVVSVGSPNAKGQIYSFDIDTTGLKLNQLRSWRITFVSGKLYGYVYQIRSNDSNTITVTSLDGPLNGVAKGDGMLIEEAPVVRPTPQNAGN